MDVVQWKVSFVRFGGHVQGQPGLSLTVSLECRGCQERVEDNRKSTVRPSDVAAGKPVKHHPGDSDSWFYDSVRSLAKPRGCAHCGMVSEIPSSTLESLIAICDTAVPQVWLEECAAILDLPTVTIDIDGGSYEGYKSEERLDQYEIDQTWHNFTPVSMA